MVLQIKIALETELKDSSLSNKESHFEALSDIELLVAKYDIKILKASGNNEVVVNTEFR